MTVLETQFAAGIAIFKWGMGVVSGLMVVAILSIWGVHMIP